MTPSPLRSATGGLFTIGGSLRTTAPTASGDGAPTQSIEMTQEKQATLEYVTPPPITGYPWARGVWVKIGTNKTENREFWQSRNLVDNRTAVMKTRHATSGNAKVMYISERKHSGTTNTPYFDESDTRTEWTFVLEEHLAEDDITWYVNGVPDSYTPTPVWKNPVGGSGINAHFMGGKIQSSDEWPHFGFFSNWSMWIGRVPDATARAELLLYNPATISDPPDECNSCDGTLASSIIGGSALVDGSPLIGSYSYVNDAPSIVDMAPLNSTFNFTEQASATSNGLMRFGVPFVKGDVPEDYVPYITQAGVAVAAEQYDEVVTYDDGSWKFCVVHMRDSDFTTGLSRDYVMKAKIGTRNNTAGFDLSDISANSDIKLELTSLSQPNEADTSNYTISLNTALATATNVTKIHSGPVCDGWFIEFAVNSHLQATFHVDVWDDGSATVNGNIEFGVLMSLPHWVASSKDRYDYTATLKDDTTTIETYSAVQHTYHAGWFTAMKDTTDDWLHGRRHWLTTANQPTLLYKCDRTNWVASGLVPPWNASYSPSALTGANTYVPMDNIGHSQNIDGSGGYKGRGVQTAFDADHFLQQTADSQRRMLVNGLVGWHINYQQRSSGNRTRTSVAPDDYNTFTGEASAAGNTHISLEMSPLSVGAYTFTSQGLADPQQAYCKNNDIASVAAAQRGGYTDYTGGTGSWVTSDSASHGVSYSAGAYMVSGERYFYDASAGLAMNLFHQGVGNSGQGRPNRLYYPNGQQPRRDDWGIPSGSWEAALFGSTLNNYRSFGWEAIISAYGWGLCPDNDTHKDLFDTYITQSGNRLTDSFTYFPQAMIDLGIVFELHGDGAGGGSGYERLFFTDMNVCNFNISANLVENAGWTECADIISTYIANAWDMGTTYPSGYNGIFHKMYGEWDDAINPFLATDNLYQVPSTNRHALVAAGSITLSGAPTMTVGDKIIPVPMDDGDGTLFPIPVELTEGVEYYVKTEAADVITLAATPGGATITYSGNATVSLIFQPTVTAAVGGTGSDYKYMAHQGLLAAHHRGHSLSTQALVDKAETYAASYTPNGDNLAYNAKEIT